MTTNLSKLQIASIGTIIAAAVLKITFLLRDILIGNYFGVTQEVDTYFYSIMVPFLFFNIISGTFNYYFIPNYLKIKTEKGEIVAQEYVVSLFRRSTFNIFLVAIIVGWALPYIFIQTNTAFFNTDYTIKHFLKLSQYASLLMFLYILCNFYVSLFQSEHKFLRSIYSQILIPIGGVTTIIAMHQHWFIASALYGQIAGALLCLLILYTNATKNNLITDKKPKTLETFPITINLKQIVFIATTLGLSQIISIIDQYMATRLGAGNLTTLVYGQRLPDGVTEIFVSGLSITMFAHYAQWFSSKETHRVIESTQRAIIYITFFVGSLCLFISHFANPIVSLLLERGQFSSENTAAVSQIMQFYCYSIYIGLVGIIGARIIAAIQKNHVLLWVGAIALLLKISLNILLVKSFGLAGLPLATLAIYSCNLLIIYFYLAKINLNIFKLSLWRELIKCIIFLGTINLILTWTFESSSGLSNFWQIVFGTITLGIGLLLTMVINQRFPIIKFKNITHND